MIYSILTCHIPLITSLTESDSIFPYCNSTENSLRLSMWTCLLWFMLVYPQTEDDLLTITICNSNLSWLENSSGFFTVFVTNNNSELIQFRKHSSVFSFCFCPTCFHTLWGPVKIKELNSTWDCPSLERFQISASIKCDPRSLWITIFFNQLSDQKWFCIYPTKILFF